MADTGHLLGRTNRVMQIVRAIKMLDEAMTKEEQKQYPVIAQLIELVESHVDHGDNR